MFALDGLILITLLMRMDASSWCGKTLNQLLSCKSQDKQWHAKFCLPDNYFYYTAIYAANTSEERNELWIKLLSIQSSLQTDSSPLIVGGDFNEILHPSEHSAESFQQFTSPMIDFKVIR